MDPAVLSRVTLVVAEYDEAIAWFRERLGFTLITDTPVGEKRFVVVTPPGGGCGLVLARAVNVGQRAEIGRQAGGRAAFFLRTGDFERDHAAMLARGVVFEETPRRETYGMVAVFRDLYGNRWDLIGPG